jgi:hypothetical protein
MSQLESRSAGKPSDRRYENVLYHAGDLWITDTRLVAGNRTYWFRDIQSLDVVSLTPARRSRYTLAYVPPLLMNVGYFGLAYINGFLGPFMQIVSFLVLVALAGLAVFVRLRLRKTRLSTYYFLRLNGKRHIYASTDGDYTAWLTQQVSRAKDGANSIPAYVQALPGIGPGEFVYYSDGVAAITSTRVILAKESFQLGQIKKAHLGQTMPAQYSLRFGLSFTLLAFNGLLSLVRQGAPNYGRDVYLLFPGDLSWIPLPLILGAVALLIWSINSRDGTTHTLRLQGKFGDAAWVEAFATLDEPYARALAAETNRAVNAQKVGINAGNATLRS